MGKKIEIILEPRTYDPSVDKPNKHYTSVSWNLPFMPYRGGSSPCDTSQDIKRMVEHFKQCIIGYGCIPVIKDLRVKVTLNGY